MTTTFGVWAGKDAEAGKGNLTFQQIEPKHFEDDDIDVKIQYCGLCGTDAAALCGHLGPVKDPLVLGHEMIGEVVRVGPKVENGIKVGDIVGVGGQADSCRECEYCLNNMEQYCAKAGFNFYGVYATGKSAGQQIIGGFAKTYRGSSHYAVKIPEGVDPSTAGPLFCGGVTVYTPLKDSGVGPGKTVGIIGVGGLGHMAIQLASAMGAKVVAISRGTSKKDDAIKLGAKEYIPTGNNLADDFKGHEGTLDLIICTINPATVPVNDYLTLLKPRGKFNMVGAPANPLEVAVPHLLFGGKSVGGSTIGSPADISELLDLVAKHKIQPWVQKYDFDDINKALVDFNAGKPRYRFVLVNKDNGGSL